MSAQVRHATAPRYLNTDLDLHSAADLTRLTAALEAMGLVVLLCAQNGEDGWRAVLEAGADCKTPEDTAVALLDPLERLTLSLRADWDCCTTRAFNIGYDCSDISLAVSHGIAPAVLRRMADLQIGLTLTLYPPGGQ